jgi:hypothetical protein
MNAARVLKLCSYWLKRVLKAARAIMKGFSKTKFNKIVNNFSAVQCKEFRYKAEHLLALGLRGLTIV